MSAIVDVLKAGGGKRRTAGVIKAAAARLKCAEAALAAIIDVESSGAGFDAKGRVKVLFEKHKFYRHLSGEKRSRAVSYGLARKEWISPKKGGYRDQPDNAAALALLIEAIGIDETAALKSASYGAGQVLGENYAMCGYTSVQAFVVDMCESEDAQINAIIAYLEKKGLADEIRALDFDAVARGYNGPGQVEVYGAKMRAAYRRHSGKEAKIESAVRATGLRMGSSGYRVQALQQRLTDLGYVVKVDGDFGDATRRAVVSFQLEHGLEKDGVVGPATQAALDDAVPVVSTERANATVGDLREEGSTIIKQADKTEAVSVVAVATGGIAAAQQTGLLGQIKDAADSVSGLGPIVEPVTDVVSIAASNVWVLLALGGLALWYAARRIKAARLKDHQTGRTV